MSLESGNDRISDSRLEALAEFAAGAGHEINNPLAVIINRAQRLLGEESDPQKRRELVAIGAQAYRIRDMIGDTMLFARPPLPVPEACDLEQAVRETAEKLAERFAEAEAELKLTFEGASQIWADPLQLKIVISSLLNNALEATGESGRIEAGVTALLEADVRFARLCVTDNGPGMSDLDRQHLFDPFYSGRQAGRGLGFGLSKCWRIVHGHGGRINVIESNPGLTTFAVDWPCDAVD